MLLQPGAGRPGAATRPREVRRDAESGGHISRQKRGWAEETLGVSEQHEISQRGFQGLLAPRTETLGGHPQGDALK